MLSQAPYDEYGRDMIPIMDCEGHSVIIFAARANGEYGVIIAIDEGSTAVTPIFATATMEVMGISFVEGYQNIDGNGDYTVPTIDNDEIEAINYGELWNGTLIGLPA